MEAHHHHNTAAPRTQQQQPSIPTAQSSPSSISSLPSQHVNPAPSIGTVPTTTAGPITISIVIALTLIICMILNCGKLKRRVSPQRYNVPLQNPPEISVAIDEKKLPTKSMRPSLGVKSPSSRHDSSPWSSSSTLLSPQVAPIHAPRQLHDDPSNLMQNHHQPQPQPPVSILPRNGPSPL